MQSAVKESAVAPDEINLSCRLPLLVLFLSGAVWLVIGSVFGLIASIKFHQPNFLSGPAWLTYGRVYPAYLNALLYGFCIPAGLGVACWLFARLGRTRLAEPWLVMVGASVWNLGVTLGVLGILGGNSTGFVTLEFPGYATLLLFVGYLLMGIAGVLTCHQRLERPLFVSQWFLLAAIFWFPWIYSTASLLLLKFPVRGVVQAVIAWWYADNFLLVWLGLVGLGAAFYFAPKLLRRDLDNHYLALFTFWTLILFASWAGIPQTAPVPAWIPVISAIAAALTILPILAVLLNFHYTLRGAYSGIIRSPALLFVCFGIGAFIVAGLMRIFSRFCDLTHQLEFSWFEPARVHLNFYGFFAMVIFGAIYYILPRVVGLEFPSPRLVRAHFWIAGAGILLIVVPFAAGGVVQAAQAQNPNLPYIDVLNSSIHFLRVSTLGDLLLLVGHLLFLGNSVGLAVRLYRLQALTAYSQATADLFKPAEVKP